VISERLPWPRISGATRRAEIEIEAIRGITPDALVHRAQADAA
jgi:hypothetical protein